ncbi:hypothetical protein CR513_09162, partial [Mucuna pruriens]
MEKMILKKIFLKVIQGMIFKVVPKFSPNNCPIRHNKKNMGYRRQLKLIFLQLENVYYYQYLFLVG